MAMPIRVLLWQAPKMLHGIIGPMIKRETDLEDITPAASDLTLLDVIEKHMPDVVVTSIRANGVDDTYSELLLVQPHLKVLAVRAEGRPVLQYKSLGDLSPEGLLTAIRECANDRRGAVAERLNS